MLEWCTWNSDEMHNNFLLTGQCLFWPSLYRDLLHNLRLLHHFIEYADLTSNQFQITWYRSNKTYPIRDQYRIGWPVHKVLVQLQLLLREPEGKTTLPSYSLKNYLPHMVTFDLVYCISCKSSSDWLSDWLAECFLSLEVRIPPHCREQVTGLINVHLPHYAILAAKGRDYQMVNN